jgi:hypothetical protein
VREVPLTATRGNLDVAGAHLGDQPVEQGGKVRPDDELLLLVSSEV